MDKKIICITGPDGSGKSTLIKSLAGVLDSVYLANIWDLMSSNNNGLPFKNKQDINNFLCGLSPNSRLLFLAHAMRYSIDKALESNKQIILIDSYYYKYFASELALGADCALVDSLVKSFPKVDELIMLELDINKACERKKVFSRYECGLSEETNSENFVKFQEKVAEEWQKMLKPNWRSISSDQKPDVILNQVLMMLKPIV